jgi:BirA family transcriptional regulator, biotin operon repressor / biotin---[acetyl-CoA-carboxylase] ligase
MPGASANVAWDVRHFDEVRSTNTVALELARAGEPEGLVVVADHQTAGRGRLGRSWQAPPGSSLLVSILLRPGADAPAHRAHLLTAAVAMAAADACQSVAGFLPSLKWPNDLVVERPEGWRKLAGVLAESDLSAGTLATVVVGIGVNVNWPVDLPPELAGIAVAANHVAGAPVDRTQLLAGLLEGVGARYGSLSRPDGWRELAEEFRRRCSSLGTRVRGELGSETVEGVASGLSDDGRLGIDTADGMRWVAAGDVTHLRPAPPAFGPS